MATPRYHLTDITPTGLSGFARDINSQGSVLAAVEREDQIQFGIVSYKGTVLELPPHDGESLSVRAINDSGTVVGAAEVEGEERACRWDDGQLQFLGTADEEESSCALDVNLYDMIVGYHTRRGCWRPLFWFGHPDRYFEIYPDFVPFEAGGLGVASAVNDRSIVVGTVGSDGFLKQQDSYQRISPPLTEAGVWPCSINDSGVFVGHVIEPDEEYPFRYASEVERLPTVAGSHGQASDINDAEIIVGASSYLPGHNDLHGAVWHDMRPYDLNEVVSNIGKYTINYASAINNAGQIAADGILDGQDRVLLLTPTA